jgi:hypothetical protein
MYVNVLSNIYFKLSSLSNFKEVNEIQLLPLIPREERFPVGQSHFSFSKRNMIQ